MYSPPTATRIGRSILAGYQSKTSRPLSHKERIRYELRRAGMSRYGLRKSESRYLPNIIQPDEHIGGVVYGMSDDSSVLLVATDQRVIFLDRKPLFTNQDELTFDVVSGVNISHVGPGATVVLHSRIKNFKIRTLNTTAAANFVKFLESRCLLSADSIINRSKY